MFQQCIKFSLALCIIYFHLLASQTQGKKKSSSLANKKFFEPIFRKGKKEGDPNSLPYRKNSQLYSRNSGKHVRVLPNRSIDALGSDGDKYAKLVIESEGFGRVRIRGSLTKLYICVDKKRRLRGRPTESPSTGITQTYTYEISGKSKGLGKRNCVWNEIFADNGYTEFRSARYKKLLLSFKRNGKQKRGKKTSPGMNSVQYVVRPWKELLRLYIGRRDRFSNNKLGRKIAKYLTFEQWRKWRRWKKQRRRKRLERKNQKLLLPTTTAFTLSTATISTMRHVIGSEQPTENSLKSES